jgi:hypothetical protein
MSGTDNWGSGIAPHHRQMLIESGITADQAHARGYRTIDTGNRKLLEQIGFVRSIRKSNGLLIPLLRNDGDIAGYQFRADQPRVGKNGKEIKYETPWRQQNVIDFPPGVAERLADHSTSVWITEGVKKGDAGACAGLAIVDLVGVWNWLSGGGALVEFRNLAPKDREVVLCFDSDLTIKESVWRAIKELGEWLKVSRHADVKYCILPQDGDAKIGLDDFLAAGHTIDDLQALVRPDLPPLAGSQPVQPVIPVYTGPPLDGSKLLDEVTDWLAKYISPTVAADLQLPLFAAHTHLIEESYTTPRLLIDSPVPGSGKTTCLEHLQHLCHRPVTIATISSTALLTRMLSIEQRTILIDEADRALNPERDGTSDLLAVINSGYKRGSTRPVLVSNGQDWEAKEMPTYAAVVMAGNNPNLPEDTRSRTIRIVLLPDDDVEESDWELIEEEALDLQMRLAAWADQVREQVRTTRPDLPEGITGRFREKWAPLKRIAVAAGGFWPEIVDLQAASNRKEVEIDREDGLIQQRPQVVILKHIYEVWPENTVFLPTADLIGLLSIKHSEVWGDEGPFGKKLTPQRLGRMLAGGYKIHSDREGGVGPRGYFRPQFDRVWRQLRLNLSGRSDESVHPVALSMQPVEPVEPVEPAAISREEEIEAIKAVFYRWLARVVENFPDATVIDIDEAERRREARRGIK